MIRQNPVGVALVGLLALTTVWGSWCVWQWYRGAREVQALEFNYERINNASAAVNSLVNESLEYSKRDPSIEPILSGYNVRLRPVQSPAPSLAPAKAELRP
jgi:hypothetical protein